MAPKGRRKSTTSKKQRRTNLKKKVVKTKKQEESQNYTSESSSTSANDFGKKKNNEVLDFEGTVDNVCSSGCSTPKGHKFRIPEILTCPPAPKKQRLVSNYSFKRSPIAFFAPPDLELFFYYALRGISV